jgi:dynein heavy chain
LELIEEYLPSIMHSIGNIHSCSHYYNTSEHMTALFIKVTNQLIKACREFCYAREPRIWEHDYDELLVELKTIRSSHKCYRTAFQSEKARLYLTSERKQFDFPAMGVFGKSDAFMNRVDRVERMSGLMHVWKGLENSKIDGVDNIWTSAKTAIKNVRTPSKPYDPLDIRQLNFEADSENFFAAMADCKLKLQNFCTSSLEGKTSQRRLQLLEQFAPIAHLGIDLEPHYRDIMAVFAKELESVRKTYMGDRANPPIPRNVPPLAGRISWARNLFKRIEDPVTAMQRLCPQLFDEKPTMKRIKTYNKTGQVLAEFEMVCHSTWSRAVDKAVEGLSATIFITDEETGRVDVNADAQVMQLVSESLWMTKLNLGRTANSDVLVDISERFKDQSEKLKSALAKYYEVLDSIPERIRKVVEPMQDQLAKTFQIGLQQTNWFSVNLPDLIDKMFVDIGQVKQYIDGVSDLLTVRIDTKYHEFKGTMLCAVPEEDVVWSHTEFEQNSEALSVNAGNTLELTSAQIERSVDHLIEAVETPFQTGFWSDGAALLETENYLSAKADLKKLFINETSSTLIRCVRNSLDLLKRRASEKKVYGSSTLPGASQVDPPMIAAKVVLTLPAGAEMVPSLDLIQQSINNAADCILKCTKSVLLWGQDRSASPESQMNNFIMVSTNKEVTRTIDSISTAVSSTKGSVTDKLAVYDKYSALWLGERAVKLEEFMGTKPKPDLSSFAAVIEKYEDLAVDVAESTDHVAVGAVMLEMSDFKLTLDREINLWKSDYATQLNQKTEGDMTQIFAFTEDLNKRLSRKIVDLEDVRLAMNSLKDLREKEIEFDALMDPIEQGYAMLVKNNVTISAAEQDQLDSMRFQWSKMNAASVELSAHLIVIQPEFKENLIGAVSAFAADEKAFRSDYNIKGPMCDGITPAEASDRLAVFQVRFDELFKRYVTYNGGEELFGLVQSEYSEIHNIKKELKLLQQLYSLYNDVVKGISGYYDIKWLEVDTEVINADLLTFGNRCRKLPKALKEWDAYKELQKKIDDFGETLPILEAMASRTMLPRHWARITDTCGGMTFDVTNEAFELRGIMEAPLLENKDEIEDICIASVKEEDIESKLSIVVKEWSAHEVYGTWFCVSEMTFAQGCCRITRLLA